MDSGPFLGMSMSLLGLCHTLYVLIAVLLRRFTAYSSMYYSSAVGISGKAVQILIASNVRIHVCVRRPEH